MNTQSRYLYGTAPDRWKDLPYVEALKVRIQLARSYYKVVVNSLQEVSETDYETYSRINHHIKEIARAIKFNQNLLEELNEL